jgi:hypothetical protein
MNQINFKMNEKKTHGGARANAGAPRKSETEQSNLIFITALKEIKKRSRCVEMLEKEFAKELLTFEREMFIAEHLFGKPVQVVEQTNLTHLQK